MVPILIICVLILGLPYYSYAQSDSSSFNLELSPQLPNANSSFSVKITGNNDNRISTQWFINGVENTAYKNQNTISLRAGTVGTVINITARITLFDGSIVETRHTVIPNRVDLIIEADTTVPAFYNGRRLPSTGSAVTATAFVFTKEKLSPDEYVYAWKLNNKTQNGGGSKGENSFSFIPEFEREVLLSVDVFDRSGKLIASKSQIIPIVKPELYFYEKNPLRGLSLVVLTDPYIFIGEETTIKAEEYFMSREIPNENLLTEWKIDNRTQNNNEENPREIILNKKGRGGSIELSFHIRNIKQLLQGVKKSLEIQF